MGRSHVEPMQQPTNYTCGPAALKKALEVLSIRKPLESLIRLCKTSKNGTSTPNLINAATSLGCAVLTIEYATLKHLVRALKYSPHKIRAVMVSYLYDLDEQSRPHPDSGHWAVVASYQASKNRIVLLDSSTAQRKSYAWADFRARWKDYDWKRKRTGKRTRRFKLIRHWQPQLMMILAKDSKHLPRFTISTERLYVPGDRA